MKRSDFIWAAAVALLVFPPGAFAQTAEKPARLAILEGGSAAAAKPFEDAFLGELASLGRKESVNLVVDRRYAEGKIERLPELAAELVRLKPDIVLAPTRLATEAVLKATRSIPVVFVNFPDPVAAGVVASLARPGGNATGFTQIPFEVTGKRLELLKEAIGHVVRLGALHSGDVTSLDDLEVLREIAKKLGIALVEAGANRREAYEVAFADFQRAKVDAVFVLISIANSANRHTISELAIRYRMATVHNSLGEMEAGGLLSYGADILALRRGAAHYVDRILKGAKPADLPVQRPTTFVLGLNLKTARSIGRTIPQSLLLRADRTIE